MRILIVNHSDINSPYGAASSLRHHLKLFDSDAKFITKVITNKRLLFISKNYKKNLPISDINISFFWVPKTDVCSNAHHNPIKKLLLFWLPNILARVARKRMLQEIKDFRPDLVHLNSFTLLGMAPLLQELSVPIIIHGRELINPMKFTNKHKLQFAHISRVVCIDSMVESRLLNLMPAVPSRVIENPFSRSRNKFPRNFPKDKVVMGVLGQINDYDKGVGFICESFIRLSNPKYLLVIVGPESSYKRALKDKYGSNSGIIFLAEIDDANESGIFSSIDIVIRGEKEFCTGRTVYEGLFNGCVVVLPKRASEPPPAPPGMLSRFLDRVVFYEPRDSGSLGYALQLAAQKAASTDRARIKECDNHSSYHSAVSAEYIALRGS